MQEIELLPEGDCKCDHTFVWWKMDMIYLIFSTIFQQSVGRFIVASKQFVVSIRIILGSRHSTPRRIRTTLKNWASFLKTKTIPV